MIVVACVRTGARYGPEWVYRLRDGVIRYLPPRRRFICLTDQPTEVPGVETSEVGKGLDGWWRKIALLEPTWRAGDTIIYFDLDAVLVGDLTPLTTVTALFATCENFARIAGRVTWPCRLNSSCMVIGPEFDGTAWERFNKSRKRIIRQCGRHGDQMAIERLIPEATLLQSVLPPNFFLGYRDLPQHTDKKPEGCSVVVFGGPEKPDNCMVPWVKKEWQRETSPMDI